MATKPETLAALDDRYNALHALVGGIDEPHGTWQGVVGSWSVVNVLQHIDGWLVEMGEGLQRLARGERAMREGADYSNADAWNAKFVEVRGDQSMAQALAAFERSHAAFRAAAAAIPDERYGDGRTANRIIEMAALDHYAEHRGQIEAYLSGSHD